MVLTAFVVVAAFLDSILSLALFEQIVRLAMERLLAGLFVVIGVLIESSCFMSQILS